MSCPARPLVRLIVVVARAGIALASNLGGMTSPISSPQNIFAIEEMGRGSDPPSWLSWMAAALPVACLGNLAIWALLLAAYRPGRDIKEVRRLPDSTVRLPVPNCLKGDYHWCTTGCSGFVGWQLRCQLSANICWPPRCCSPHTARGGVTSRKGGSCHNVWEVRISQWVCTCIHRASLHIRRAQDRISGVQVFVLLVSVATVGLWCANGALADVFGEMGIIAVLPMVAFFGFGVLGKACPCFFRSASCESFSTVCGKRVEYAGEQLHAHCNHTQQHLTNPHSVMSMSL